MNQLRAVLLGIALAILIMPFSPSVAEQGKSHVGGAKCPTGQTMPLTPGACIDSADLHQTVCAKVTLVLGSVAVASGGIASLLFLTGVGAAFAALFTGLSWITGLVSAGIGSVCISLK